MQHFLGTAFVVATVLAPVAVTPEKAAPIPVTGDAVPDLAPFDDTILAFMRDNEIPAAALAVAKDGKIIYSRGFGWADVDNHEKTLPTSLFRIASISKPITAVAILMLVERGKLKLDDKAFDLLPLQPPPGRKRDPRLKDITVRHLLQHTGGWDRAKSFDPMFRPLVIAKDLGTTPPAGPNDVIRYMLTQPLDFDPGSRYAYSNFGYCVLGRIVEQVSGQPYEKFVQDEVLKPLGITRTRLGKTLTRAADEVKYTPNSKNLAPAVIGPEPGKLVPGPYGAWHLEAMDAHGGWISSAVDLVRFASAFDRPDRCPILKRESVEAMFARPEGRAGHDAAGKPTPLFYGLGWSVRPHETGLNAWHNGALDGTATLMLRRFDGLDWAVLFNRMVNKDGKYLGALIDPLLHRAAAKVSRWP